jgi:hypothetical protein
MMNLLFVQKKLYKQRMSQLLHINLSGIMLIIREVIDVIIVINRINEERSIMDTFYWNVRSHDGSSCKCI